MGHFGCLGVARHFQGTRDALSIEFGDGFHRGAQRPAITIGKRTVDAHVMNLRKKIEPDRSAPVFVETVFGQGYRFGGERA